MVQLALLALLLVGCSSPRLYGKLEKVGPEVLVSHALATPDPAASEPIDGQRLVVTWLLGPGFDLSECTLKVALQTQKAESIELCQPIERRWGHWSYYMPGSELRKGRAIVAYRLEILKAGQLLERLDHKLYRPLIDLDRSP